MTEPLLVAREVQARYGPVRVLDDVSFTVDEGEIVAILGANGAGKTTMLRAISGTVTTAGSIRLSGRELVGRTAHQIARLGVAHVPEGRGTFVDLSVEDNLAAGAYARRDRRAVRRDIERWYTIFPPLASRRSQPAGRLSGGEQQMLAIARALIGRPRLVLLDEPSHGLAPLTVDDVFTRLSELNEDDGVTMLVVEQNARVALSIAARGYVLEGGRIAVSGFADQLAADDAVRHAYLGR